MNTPKPKFNKQWSKQMRYAQRYAQAYGGGGLSPWRYPNIKPLFWEQKTQQDWWDMKERSIRKTQEKKNG